MSEPVTTSNGLGYVASREEKGVAAPPAVEKKQKLENELDIRLEFG